MFGANVGSMVRRIGVCSGSSDEIIERGYPGSLRSSSVGNSAVPSDELSTGILCAASMTASYPITKCDPPRSTVE